MARLQLKATLVALLLASVVGSYTYAQRIDGSGVRVNGASSVLATKVCLDGLGVEPCLYRDAANSLSLRNGTSAQIFRVFQTFTDTSNFRSLDIDVGTGGVANIRTNWAGTGTTWDLKLQNSILLNGSSGLITQYPGSVNTAGQGVAVIRANGRATAQTAANASISTYTVGVADGSFEVSANVLVTTATTHTFTVECAYTDEGNTARVVTLSFEQLAGTLTTSITNTNGAVPYEGVPFHIRAKAATSITVRTQAAGVYTSVVYNAEGIIKQSS